MATNPLRDRMLANPNFSVDRWARSRGFDSAHAMEGVLQAGVDLKTTGRISDESLAKVLSAYAPSLAPQIRSAARELEAFAQSHGNYNAVGALMGLVSGEDSIDSGRAFVDKYHDAQIQEALDTRRAAAEKSAPRVQQPPSDPNSVRANIERLTAVRTDKPRTEVLADALEKTVNRKEALQAAPAFFSLRDHLSVNFDDAVVSEEVDKIEDASTLNDGFDPTGEQP